VKLGIANVDLMLHEMTWNQFVEWKMFAQLEPFDEEREDIRNAAIVRTMLNVLGWDRRRRPKPYSLDDVLLRFGDMPKAVEKKEPVSWQHMKRMGMMISGMLDTKPPASLG
jgi:hypothetical protein